MFCQEPPMQASIVLTVAEGKRLIAKGLVAADFFRRALDEATVAVCKGTTNAYLVEEILGQRIEKRNYAMGVTVPVKRTGGSPTTGSLPDLVMQKGKRLEGVSAVEAVKLMEPGDCFVKGANALNLQLRQAALLIGHPTGGTIGAALGTVVARRIRLVVPVGLEKSVPTDLFALARQTAFDAAIRAAPDELIKSSAEAVRRGTPALWPLWGDIFTEIDALRTLAGVEAVPMAAGGIAGAEGAVWLLLRGSTDQVDKALAVMDGIWGEPPFAG
jgi:hypothetical protein